MSAIVLHDEQNLFDPATSTDGATWEVEAAVAALGVPLTVLSVPHAGERRSWEYVGDGLEPHVDRLLGLVEGADGPVGVGGSSFGAYASLYAWARHPTVFTRVLAMSPALWVRRERLFEAVEAAKPAPGTRVWIDVGGRESPRFQARYDAGYSDMRALLKAKGCLVGGFRDPEAPHHETAWAKRLPDALHFLYAPAP